MKKSFKLTTREMVEIAILIAIAIVLDIAGIKIVHASFTMVPLFIIAYRHGFVKSIIAICFIYSFVTVLTDGWSVNFISLLLDYVLGYGSICLAALFSKKIFNESSKHYQNILWMELSILIASVLRVGFSTVSGVVVWETPWLASFLDNLLIYVGWDCLLALIVMPLLYYPLGRLFKQYPISK